MDSIEPSPIYVSAMPSDPAQLYEPAVLAARVADAWLAYRAEVQAREVQRVEAN